VSRALEQYKLLHSKNGVMCDLHTMSFLKKAKSHIIDTKHLGRTCIIIDLIVLKKV